jgi:orotate phosphoribosyltransferase
VLDALSHTQREFISVALQLGVLRFGSFTLKSGRVSPYFFNAGAFRSGSALGMLGRTYAAAIAGGCGVPAFDVLFGPAYKGIPLVTAAAVALAALPPAAGGRDVPVAYNRKEAKDHGEGGVMVGAELAGRRVLIVDDVISAGTAIGESVALLRAAGAIPVGVVIGLDRQERGGGESAASAVQAVTAAYGIPVHAVVTLDHLLAFLAEAAAGGPAAAGAGLQAGAACYSGLALGELLAQVTEYRAVYGVAAAPAPGAGQ